MNRQDIIDKLEQDSVTINLLLTEQCNFSCAHCMYECGPSKPSVYMSNQVLRAIGHQVQALQEEGIYPSINLIGGEPTLDMERFAEILNEVRRWDAPIEMSTNGHWLTDDELTVEFFSAVKWIQGEAETFTVRISNDQYHDYFRPAYYQGDKLKHRLDEIFEYGEAFYKFVPFCPNCSSELENDEDDRDCPECGEYMHYVDSEAEDLVDFRLEEPNPGYPWIYVESTEHHSGSKICPQGRASSWGGADDGSSYPGECGGDKLSYLPDGRLMDICCKGSWCEFGTAFDDPIELFGKALDFLQEERPSCYECRELAENWKRENLQIEEVA